MASAEVNAVNSFNQRVKCRGLLDTCSTINLITEDLANSLKLTKTHYSIPIGAVNGLTTFSKYSVTVSIESRTSDYKRMLTFLTVKEISSLVPRQSINRNNIQIPPQIRLADPNFHQPSKIDLLINAGTTFSLLCVGQINLSPLGGPDLYLQKTRLGWIIGGNPPSQQGLSAACHLTNKSPDFDLRQFWEIEEGSTNNQFSDQEIKCQNHFQLNTVRNNEGRYVVALPFNDNIQNLGESKFMALKRFKSIERKLETDSDLKQKYNAVLQEYLTLGHMSLVNEASENESNYYLPHHAVFKPSSVTTKLRVVFDGSAKTTTGISLNDTLYVGPTIQPDIFSLLLRFRKHQVVLTGDIEKMYRQVLVRPEDRKFQRILWRTSAGPVQTYELNTVTFGLSPAPYLAIQTLHQLANDEQHTWPQAARILQQDFYVDDVLTGASSRSEAIKIRNDLTQLLESGGFTICQWASNDPKVLEQVPKENINLRLSLGESTTLKTLGVCWNSLADTITYTVNPTLTSVKITKRFILSETAKIFDPLGLLAPIIVTAKILMQKLWSAKLDWDESLPMNLHTEWTNYYQQLSLLDNFSFKRFVTCINPANVQLHGFCDASEKAYGACIYLRTKNKDNSVKVELLCAKSRVAPLKSVTIPRLELCGALLLVTLLTKVQTELQVNIDQTFCWSDSTIVLHWLKSSPHQLKTFVANRVSEIQQNPNQHIWRHVRTNHNPADLVSRGVSPAEFVQTPNWQHGPVWLALEEQDWPVTELPHLSEIPEQKSAVCFATKDSLDSEILHRYSSLSKLQRIVAYCFRLGGKSKTKGFLTVPELRAALQCIIRLTQQCMFAAEIRNITEGRSMKFTNKLARLNPFVDKCGILRVGGRLQHSYLPYSSKHPIILPKNHHITNLIILSEHRNHFHAGTQATLYAVRRRYWPLDGRSQVWKTIKPCLQCNKANPPLGDYLMGNLPSPRVTEARPFTHVGIDYCGPFLLKEKKHRNRNKIKSYVAVFICLSTKAVHLELVSDLTSEGFLAALRRFIGRRGFCTNIYSDNGRNFVGANNELREIVESLKHPNAKEKVHAYLNSKQISWHFIPPQSPHFGGLWEAAVKSFKFHLRRVAGIDLLFTFEEFNTLAIEIEAILNSRPLTPISSDPNDPIVLTPGHFIIGDSLTNLPEQDKCDISNNRLSTWQHIQKVKHHFWKRWKHEYLNELTVRGKWNQEKPNIKEGAIVLLKDDNLPPLQWDLGRVVQCHPGTDGVIRTVTVQTPTSSFKRNVRKLAPLPI